MDVPEPSLLGSLERVQGERFKIERMLGFHVTMRTDGPDREAHQRIKCGETLLQCLGQIGHRVPKAVYGL